MQLMKNMWNENNEPEIQKVDIIETDTNWLHGLTFCSVPHPCDEEDDVVRIHF